MPDEPIVVTPAAEPEGEKLPAPIPTEGAETATPPVPPAPAEAQAIAIQAQAITSQGGAEYVQLQWIKAWDGVLPTTVLDSSTSTFFGL